MKQQGFQDPGLENHLTYPSFDWDSSPLNANCPNINYIRSKPHDVQLTALMAHVDPKYL